MYLCLLIFSASVSPWTYVFPTTRQSVASSSYFLLLLSSFLPLHVTAGIGEEGEEGLLHVMAMVLDMERLNKLPDGSTRTNQDGYMNASNRKSGNTELNKAFREFEGQTSLESRMELEAILKVLQEEKDFLKKPKVEVLQVINARLAPREERLEEAQQQQPKWVRRSSRRTTRTPAALSAFALGGSGEDFENARVGTKVPTKEGLIDSMTVCIRFSSLWSGLIPTV